MVATLIGLPKNGYDLVRAQWQSSGLGSVVDSNLRGGTPPTFEGAWRKAVHDGVVPETALPAATLGAGSVAALPAAPAISGLEVVFRADPFTPGQAAWPRFDRTGQLMSLRPAGPSQTVSTDEYRTEHQCDVWDAVGD